MWRPRKSEYDKQRELIKSLLRIKDKKPKKEKHDDNVRKSTLQE